MSRRKGHFVQWKSNIPEELALKIELALYDRNAGKPAYSARSRLITDLLQDWWDRLPEEKKQQALTSHLEATRT